MKNSMVQSHWPPCGCLTATSGQWLPRWTVQRKTILITAESSIRQCCPKVLGPPITNVFRRPATHSLLLLSSHLSHTWGMSGAPCPPGLLLRLSLPGLQGGVPNCPLTSRKSDRLGNLSSLSHSERGALDSLIPSQPALGPGGYHAIPAIPSKQ